MKDRISWISHQKDLLEKERLAEIEASTVQVEDVALKQLEAKGIAISRLIIEESFTGRFGQHTVTLTPRRRQGITPSLPSNSFSSGDVVGLWESGGNHKGQIASGVVSKVTSTSIQVALDDEASELEQLPDDALIRLHKLANDVTYKRIKKGLEELAKLGDGPSRHLIEVLFKEAEPYEPLPLVPSKLLTKTGELDVFSGRLDHSQVDAVKFALMQKDLAVVHGPPGTGKTTTLVEIILQHVKLGSKVLASAPSNLAVDNLLERLVDCRVNVVRVGHPARATPKAQQRTLDALIQSSDEFSLIQDIHKDIKASLLSLSKTKEKGKRARIRAEVKIFRKELKEREMRLSKDILSRSEVVLATLTSSGNSGPLKLLSENHFDVTVIDECSQGMECACYLSAMKAPKLLIAGDHQQLPPTVLSTEAAKEGLMISLMERVIEMYKDRVTRMLKMQYRMNKDIMDWSSAALYESQVEAHSSVCSHLLCQMNDVDSVEDTENALVLIDTAGCDFEEVSGDDLSKGNEGEAAIVAEQVKLLINSGVQQKDLAVISPYNLQVEFIRGLLRGDYPFVEVRSVDGFQGREKEAVIISLVRSNKQGDIGFLSEERRLNVAVTRARRHLTLVGDTDTVCRNAFIRSLVDHITVRGIVKSGHEFESVNTQPFKTSLKVAPLDIFKASEKKGDQKSKKREKPHHPSEEETEKRRKELEEKISEFIKSPEKSCLEFPKKLNSFERFLVHEIAEQNGLVHESHGEGEDRFIVLKRKTENGKGDKIGVGGKGEGNEPFFNKENCKGGQIDVEKGKNSEPCFSKESCKGDHIDVDEKGENREPFFSKENYKGDKVDVGENGENSATFFSKKNCKGDQIDVGEKGENSEPFFSKEAVFKGEESEEQKLNKKELKYIKNEREGSGIKDESLSRDSLNKENESCDKKSKLKSLQKRKKEKMKPRENLHQRENIGNVTRKPSRELQTTSCETQQTECANDQTNRTNLVTKRCEICRSEIFVRNFDVHVLRCEKLKSEKRIKDEIDKRQTEIKGVNKKKKGKEDPQGDDDFEIMVKYSKENNSCAFPRCKNPSIILLQLCCYCRNNFCLKHHQAEIHGCGEEAKRHARTVLIKSTQHGILTPGSGVPSKKLDPVKKGQLQRKLCKKLEEMGDQRKGKKAKDE